MDQETIVAEIERRAFNAGVSMGAVCRLANLSPTTFSRWKRTDRNPEPIGATLHSIAKLHAALAHFEAAERRRSRRGKAVAA